MTVAQNKRARRPTRQQLLETLQTLYPDATDFYQEQDQVIDCILGGRDVLAVFPTGSGKSVCYQMPAMYLPGITLVVTPLLALMEDQVNKLKKAGFPAACLSSSLIADKNGRVGRDKLFLDIYRDRENGYKNYKLLYVTPERLRDGRFIRFAQHVDISMIAVDEAHCVSLWGFSFRPRYLELARFVRCLGYHPIIAAFTATATQAVRDDITALLKMRKNQGEYQVVGDEIKARSNLKFSVRHFASNEEKLPALLEELKARPEQCGYVFCSSISAVNQVYRYLRQNGINATRYFAPLDKYPYRGPDESKAANFQSFMDGKTPVMVCTPALGMGIDKADIRFVLHFNLPLSLENYYQEAGRAGRDGLDADCTLFYAPSDKDVCEGLIQNSMEKRRQAEKDRQAEKKYWIEGKRLEQMCLYAEEGPEKTGEALHQEILDYLNKYRVTAETAQKRRDNALKRMKRIDTLYVNTTSVANALRKGRMAGEDLEIGKGAYLSYQVTGETLEYFDLMVADAVYTLMCHRVPTIRAKNVMALLSGNSGLRLHPKREQAVEDRIRKMARARIVIDKTKAGQYHLFCYEPPQPKLDGAFLPLWEKSGGFGYDPQTPPPLYELAEMLGGQFFTLPVQRLRATGHYASDRALSMTHYLLLRIRMMSALRDYYGRRRTRSVTSRTLNFQNMLKALNIAPPDISGWYGRRDANTLWEQMLAILRSLQGKAVIQSFRAPSEEERSTLPLSRWSVSITRYIPPPPDEK